MGKKIYGVDPDGKITPLMVRDAIIRCFEAAHAEILAEMNKNMEFRNADERKAFERLQTENIIMDVFDRVNADFNNPTRADIIRVLDALAEFASKFRKPEIIKKHYGEIMRLVKRME